MRKKLKNLLLGCLILVFGCMPLSDVSAAVNGIKGETILSTSISLNKTSDSLVTGQEETLLATIAPENATNKSITWSSSNSSIASVDTLGKVKALKAGTATITATTQDGSSLSAACTIKISQLATGIVLNKTVDSLVVGQIDTLSVLVSPRDTTNKNVKWSSSDPDIATVDDSGKITAIKTGTATITATVDDGRNLHAPCIVHVTDLLTKKKKADIVITLDNSMNINKDTFKDKLNQYIESKLKGSDVDYTLQSIEGYKSKKVLIIQDQPAWESGTKVFDDIKAEGYTSDVITASQIPNVELTKYSHIYIPSDQDQNFYNNLQQSYSRLESWASGGGILVFNAADEGHHSGQWSGNFLGLSHTPQNYQPTITIVKQDPILTRGLPTSISGNYAAHSEFTAYPSDATIFAVGSSNKPTILEYRYGNGLVFAQTTTAEYYATNSGQLSPYLDNEIKYTIQKTLSKSFPDALKKPTWRDNSTKFVVNLGDNIINDINGSNLPSMLSNLSSNKTYLALVGSKNNASTLNSLISKNDERGIFIDNSDLDAALNKVGDYVLSTLDQQQQHNGNIFLVGDEINYSTYNNEDADILWSYSQDNKHLNYNNEFENCSKTGDISLDNDLGLSDFATGEWVHNKVLEFDKPGKYTISYKDKKGQVTTEIINVHRKPTPIFTAYAVANPSTGKFDVTIKDEDKSYDIDHENSDGTRRGIVNSRFQWKEVTNDVTDTWHDGKLPSGQAANKDFLVKLEVQDLEGQWSDPLVKYISTKNQNLVPVAQFTESTGEMPVDQLKSNASAGNDVVLTDESYDANGDSIREHWVVTDLGGNKIYDGSTMPTASVFIGKPLGTYNITLTCDDGPSPKFGTTLTSEPYTLQLKLVPINHKPTAHFEVDNTSKSPELIKITEDSTDADGDSISTKTWIVTDSNGAIVEQTENKLPDLTSLNGTYTITLKVRDNPKIQPELWSDPYNQTIIVENSNPKK